MLGQFLEISVHSPQVLETLQWFERLGFAQIRANDTWQHAYGIATDGRCFIGVHEYEFPSPSLTFVAPELRKRVEPLEEAGAEFEFLKLADTEFHELGFYAPDEQMVCLIEARTFSPPAADSIGDSLLGYFQELRLPVEDEENALAQWLRYGLIEHESECGLRDAAAACCTGLNLAFSEARSIRKPTLIFQHPDCKVLTEDLERRGITPRRVDEQGSIIWLSGPGGVELCVLND